MSECSISEFDVHTEHYGKDDFQLGDLYVPRNVSFGIVCLFHGGFWKMPYDRFQLSRLSIALATNGFAVWNIEYRRTGWAGGGYHGTFDDAIDSVNYLSALKEKHKSINLKTLYIAGHSAGGHLALWLGGKGRGVTTNSLSLAPSALIGMAPVTDLVGAFRDSYRTGFVSSLMNNKTPEDIASNYLDASPIAILPSSVEQLVIHGDADNAIPLVESEVYISTARASGDIANLVRIEGGHHMDFVDPDSTSGRYFIDWIVRRTKEKPNQSLNRTLCCGPSWE